MRGFLGRALRPFWGLGRALVAWGYNPVLPAGDVRVDVEDVVLVEVVVIDT